LYFDRVLLIGGWIILLVVIDRFFRFVLIIITNLCSILGFYCLGEWRYVVCFEGGEDMNKLISDFVLLKRNALVLKLDAVGFGLLRKWI
jgi:hypothetical protein